MASKRPRVVPLETLPEGMVDQVAGEVVARRAVPLRKLTKLKLVRAAEAELQEKLIRAGLERTARHVRVPLPDQLRALLGDASLVPLTGLGKKLGGATQTEAKAVAFDLVRAGELRLVVAGGKDHLARPSAEQLDASAIRSLSAAVARIAQLLRKAAPKRGQPDRSLRRSEVAPLLVEANRLTAIGGDGVSQAVTGDSDRDLVLETLASLGRSDPLVYLPELVRSLADRAAPERVLAALDAAALDGRVELRPESGLGTLSSEDAALCLPGPQGSVLSYARCLPERRGEP